MSKPIAIKGSAPNWDTRSADNCRLPELIPSICDSCRDYAYCHNKTNLPCDDCVYDIQGCCAYDEPLGRYCVLGSAFKPKDKQISIFDILGG